MTTQSPTYDAFSRSVRIVDAIMKSSGLVSAEPERSLLGGGLYGARADHAAAPHSMNGSGNLEHEMRLLFGAGLKEEEVKRIVGEGGRVQG